MQNFIKIGSAVWAVGLTQTDRQIDRQIDRHTHARTHRLTHTVTHPRFDWNIFRLYTMTD